MDLLGVLSVGLLLTGILAAWSLVAQPPLEDSILFASPTRWWNVYIFKRVILLGACPVLLAFFSPTYWETLSSRRAQYLGLWSSEHAAAHLRLFVPDAGWATRKDYDKETTDGDRTHRDRAGTVAGLNDR